MKRKTITLIAEVSPADYLNSCGCVRETASGLKHPPPTHVGGHKRITATVWVVAGLCLCLLPPAIAAPGSWTQKADMPAPAGPTASCVVDGITRHPADRQHGDRDQ